MLEQSCGNEFTLGDRGVEDLECGRYCNLTLGNCGAKRASGDRRRTNLPPGPRQSRSGGEQQQKPPLWREAERLKLEK